jgi:hypothetical protein
MPSWSSERRLGKNLHEQKRDRDQRYRDARAEAPTEYLADIASGGPTGLRRRLTSPPLATPESERGRR